MKKAKIKDKADWQEKLRFDEGVRRMGSGGGSETTEVQTLRINVADLVKVHEVVDTHGERVARNRDLLKAFAEKIVEKMRGLGFLEIDLHYRSATEFEFKIRLKKKK